MMICMVYFVSHFMVFVRPLNWIAERRWVAPTKGHLPLNEFDSSEAHVNDPHLLGYYLVYFRTTGKAVRIRGSHYRRSLTLRAKIHRQEQKGDVIDMGWMRWLASAVGLPTADLAA